MENKIDFYFNPLFKEGTEFVLQNLRNVYPSNISKVFVWIDDDYLIKDKIIDIANKYEATPIRSTGKFTWCSDKNPAESRLRLLEWCRRLQKTAELSDAKWILYLEDDVLIRDKITNFPDTKLAINPGMVASGGSIYDRQSIIDVLGKYSNNELFKIMQPFPFYFAADRLMVQLYFDCNVPFSKFEDLADGIPPEKTDKPLLHNIKTHYPSYWKEYRNYLNGAEIDNPIQ